MTRFARGLGVVGESEKQLHELASFRPYNRLANTQLSSDPTLTADSLRSLIIAGAIAGGRNVIDATHTGGLIPIINAYESLKLAARRLGGPICGQRVWAENQNLYVERSPGASPELLASIGEPIWNIDVVHGGRHINYETPSNWGYLTYITSWGQGPSAFNARRRRVAAKARAPSLLPRAQRRRP